MRINEHRLVLDVNSLNPPGGSLSCSIQAESGHGMCLRSLPAVLRVDDDSGEEEEVIEMHKHKIPLHKILQERLVPACICCKPWLSFANCKLVYYSHDLHGAHTAAM